MANSVNQTFVSNGPQSLVPFSLNAGTYSMTVTGEDAHQSAQLEWSDGHRWYPVPGGYCQAGQTTAPVIPTGGQTVRINNRGRAISVNIV